MTPLFSALFDSLDKRMKLKGPTRQAANKVFPANWSFLLGEVATISFGVLVATGIFLTLFYRASTDPVVYTGSNEFFNGVTLPAAFESVIRLSDDIPGGLFVRRVHRAASHLFIATIVLHMLRIIMTGAFRKPRELNYHVGIGLLTVSLAEGFLGYSLPYDSLAGTGIRVAYSIVLSIPYVGENVAFWVFGGEFPTGDIIPRFQALHVFVLPLVISGLIAVHVAILIRQKHTQMPKPDVDGHTYIVGKPLWPGQFAESTTLFLWVGGLLALSSTLIPWSDVELLGPYLPGEVGNNAQPDWFLFWTDGLLRALPPFEFTILGGTFNTVFVAGAVIPGIMFGLLIAYPFLERKVYKLEGDWHVLTNPLDIPLRGAMVMGTFSFVLLASANATNDILSRMIGIPIETMVWVFRLSMLFAPPLLAYAVYRYSKQRLIETGSRVATNEQEAQSRFDASQVSG
ncbi:cytochrome b [Euzebya tangerina]|uniref:cytochrome b n=1 Tax=Euzebya tangerina TaxID=591198 RepID=UPI000E31C3D8|nr:cytochrome b N-terminal domain-containing protein [Euzebya tangerina]